MYAPDSIPNYDLGIEATYVCDPGFSLEGNLTSTCLLLGSISMWDIPIEEGSQNNTGLILSISLVAVVILLLILIAITLFTIIIIRRKLKHERMTVLHLDHGHNYEDPEQLCYARPPLPCGNIHVEDNQAYEKTLKFEMDENKAYTSWQTPESEVQRPSSEGKQEDEMG